MLKKILLPHQGAFIQAPYVFPEKRNFLLVAGYGAGKTSSVAQSNERKVKFLQGKKDKEGHNPRLILGGVTLGHLEKTTLAYIIQDYENSGTPYKHDTKNNILTVGNVETLITPLQNPGAIMGYDVWSADLDEVDDLGIAAGEDTTFEAVKAVNERVRQLIPGMRKPFICMGSTSQGQRGLYRLYTQFKKAGTGFVLMRGRTQDNWYLDPSYVRSLEEIYNERERRVFLDGEFLAISKGQVFGDFDWKRNYSEEEMDRHIASDETLYWGQDFNQGYHRGSISVVRGNVMYVIKRYEFLEIRDAPKVIRYDFPTQKIFFIPDTTAKEQVMHFMKELREHKIHWIIRGKNPLVEDSAFLVNKLLYTSRLIITRGARETAESMSLFHRDKNGAIPKGIGPNDSAHDCDSVRLVAFFLACNRRAFADIAKLTIGRHDYIDEDKGALTELASGYCDLAPEILH